ncbi:MAG TPA: FHA domain-containing protein [Ktedonobacterales bacterium]
MERCPNCGVETRPGDQFCLNCGNRLTGSQPAGNQNPWGAPQQPAGPAAPVFPTPGPGAPPFHQWGPPPGSSPASFEPPTSPTLPTAQAPFDPGHDASGTTVANTGGPVREDPTMISPPEVLEATMVAPEAPAPEALAPTAMAPVAEPPDAGNAGDYLETVVASMETRAAVEEEVDVTITSVNESPAKLIVSRNGQTREFLLKKPDISIGRAPSNDIALSGDQLASRRHALIHFDGVSYVIRDLVSANGTYINGVELRSPTPLSNGDHVGVGEHELIFFSVAESAAEPTTMTFHQPEAAEVNPETVPVPGQADTLEPFGAYVTQGDSVAAGAWENAAVSQEDVEEEIKTTTDAELVETAGASVSAAFATVTYEEQDDAYPQASAYPEMASASAQAEVEVPEATIIERIELTEESSVSVVEEEEEVEEGAPADISIAERLRLTETVNEEDMPLPVPQLPEIPTMLSAIKSLDSTTAEMRENLRQAKILEEEAQRLRDQLRAATDAISNHDNSVAILAQRLRVGVADVSNRLNKVIEEVQRADESLSIADLMKLIDDVRSDPRDIYTLGSLARRARELAQFFEMHQHVNQILSECLATLNDLLSAEQAVPES